jgi:excisionase family DNA binding protein
VGQGDRDGRRVEPVAVTVAGMAGIPDGEELLTPSSVARLFRVRPKTVVRWAEEGKLTAVRTPGGHRRFLGSEVRRLLAAEDVAADE